VRIENRSRASVHYTLDDQAFDVAPRVIRTHTLCIPPMIKFSLPEGSKLPGDDQLAPAHATTYVITNAPKGVAVNVTQPKK
jgi:hypothetical protein